MPCPHKFAADLFLDRLDFNPTTLIIGTFNPAWDSLGNYASWFYGRTQNNYFWDILPRIYDEPSLKTASHHEWKAFCKAKNIALTDLIVSINDADEADTTHVDCLKSYRDDLIIRQFNQIIWNDIPAILDGHPSLTQVYLTRSATAQPWQRQWRAVTDYCLKRGIYARCLHTPSGGARFQKPKNSTLSLSDFIPSRWLEAWHFA